MSKQEKPKESIKPTILIDEYTEKVFTDIIELAISDEVVHIKTAVRNPDNKELTATHDIIMTLPHFLRFAQVVTGLADTTWKELNKNLEKKK